MKTETIKQFRHWCLDKVSKSRGTTDIYSQCLKHTPDIDISQDYMSILKMLNGRINSNISRSAHMLFLRFLKQKTFDIEGRKQIDSLRADLKDIDIEPKKRGGELKDRIFTVDELDTIRQYVSSLKVMKTRDFGTRTLSDCEIKLNRILIEILYDTAGRGNEVCQYTYPMIDFKKLTVRVPKEITKRNKSRTADISVNAAEMLKDYISTCSPDLEGRIFVQFSNVTQMRAFIKKVTKKAIGRECTLHFFRNSKATHYAEKKLKDGVHISIIAEELRRYFQHSDIKTSMSYIKIAEEQLRCRMIDD